MASGTDQLLTLNLTSPLDLETLRNQAELQAATFAGTDPAKEQAFLNLEWSLRVLCWAFAPPAPGWGGGTGESEGEG